jgi:hypothetical protein
LAECRLKGVNRQMRRVFLACETFFLRGKCHTPINDYGDGSIMAQKSQPVVPPVKIAIFYSREAEDNHCVNKNMAHIFAGEPLEERLVAFS